MLKAYLAHRASRGRELPGVHAPPRDPDALTGNVRGGRAHERQPPCARRSPLIVPETAPFTAEQRAWLNGFFAGLLSLDGDGSRRCRRQDARRCCPASSCRRLLAEDDDGAPWHDQTMPLAERMKLAEGRPLPRRMMAAMAQQDCGQCGYDCKDYSDALFAKKEERLNLCVPGGKETARMLKTLHEEIGAAPRRSESRRAGSGSAAATPALPRRHVARQPGRRRPSCRAPGSTSRARRRKPGISRFDLDANAGSTTRSATPSALYPHNDPALADAVLAALGAPPDFPIGGRTLARGADRRRFARRPRPTCCSSCSPTSPAASGGRKAQALAAGEDPDGDAATLDVLAAIEKFSGVRPDPEAFIEALDPLQPRLYSISSSPKAHPGRVALTVDAVRYDIGKRQAAGRRLDLPRRARRAGRPAQRLCAEGARLRPAGRSQRCRSS